MNTTNYFCNIFMNALEKSFLWVSFFSFLWTCISCNENKKLMTRCAESFYDRLDVNIQKWEFGCEHQHPLWRGQIVSAWDKVPILKYFHLKFNCFVTQLITWRYLRSLKKFVTRQRPWEVDVKLKLLMLWYFNIDKYSRTYHQTNRHHAMIKMRCISL